MTIGEAKTLLGNNDSADVTTLDPTARIQLGEALDMPDAAAKLRAQ